MNICVMKEWYCLLCECGRERGRQTDFVVSSTLVFIYFCRHLYELCFFAVLTEQLILFFLKCATSTNILLTQLFLHTFCIPEQVFKSGFISVSHLVRKHCLCFNILCHTVEDLAAAGTFKFLLSLFK